MAHMEIVSTIIYQLTRNLTPEQIKAQGFDTYFVDHTTGVYPQAASGMPFSTATLQVTGDALADLFEDMAAEQKARLTYDNILRLAADHPEVKDVIKFLREREIVHFQRFGECLRIVQDNLDPKNFYAFNPSFDKCCNPPDVVATPKAVPVPAACTIPSPCGQGTTTGCMAKQQCGCGAVETPCAPVQNCGCAKPCAPVQNCGCVKPCAPKQECCYTKPACAAKPGCGCNQMMQDQVLTPCACDVPTTLPDYPCTPCAPSPCGPTPYAPAYNKRPNRSCGCG